MTGRAALIGAAFLFVGGPLSAVSLEEACRARAAARAERGLPPSNECRTQPASSGAAAAPSGPTSSAAGSMMGGLIGGALGAALVPALPPVEPRQKIRPLDDDDGGRRDPTIDSGVKSARDLLAEYEQDPAGTPAHRQCPADASVVCLIDASEIPDLAGLSEEEAGSFAEVDAGSRGSPEIAPAAPSPGLEQFRDTALSSWDDFTTALGAADVARFGLATAGKLSQEASEALGSVADAVSLVDAGVKAAQGKAVEAAGEVASVAVGALYEPAAVGAEACGFSAWCTNVALKGTDAVINSPIQPLAEIDKGTVSGALVEERALRDGISRDEARRRVEQDVQRTADGMKDNGRGATNQLVCGFLGSGSGECK